MTALDDCRRLADELDAALTHAEIEARRPLDIKHFEPRRRKEDRHPEDRRS